MSDFNRRTFLATAAVGAAAWSARAASDRLTVGVMGTGGRGTELARSYSKLTGVTVSHVCDVDEGRAGAAAGAVEKAGGPAPKVIVGDFRKILDEKSVDILIVAACNHWHAPAAILGCKAGKHVYVEKPCSHNPREGEILVEVAAKHKRQVQMGNQRRSYAHFIEAIQLVKEGILGRTYLAKSAYYNNRPSIGKGMETDPPKGLDYALWQGPAPHKPFRSNYLHYNWHWFWHWGNGELGNNGVHSIDICRWGLGVDFPTHVSSSGGRYRYEDDQETPDTHHTCYQFEGRKSIVWEGLSCNVPPGGSSFDISFYGEKGSLVIRDNGYSIHDLKGKETKQVSAKPDWTAHLTNFVESIRGGAKLTSDIVQAHRSTLLCHLGNIAQRTGRSLKCDPKNGHILDDSAAMKLWTREYAKGWEPTVS